MWHQHNWWDPTINRLMIIKLNTCRFPTYLWGTGSSFESFESNWCKRYNWAGLVGSTRVDLGIWLALYWNGSPWFGRANTCQVPLRDICMYSRKKSKRIETSQFVRKGHVVRLNGYHTHTLQMVTESFGTLNLPMFFNWTTNRTYFKNHRYLVSSVYLDLV